RTVISILAVSLGVTLMLVIDGIISGMLNDTANRTLGLGADYILNSSDSGMLYALSQSALPIKLADKIREIKGVGAVTPILQKFIAKDFGMVFGIDLPSYDQFPGTLQIVEGRRSLVGDDMIVDQLYAMDHQIKPGMHIKISEHPFTVTGICRRGSVVREFVPLATLQKIQESGDNVSFFFIKAAPGADMNALDAELRKVFPGYYLISANDADALLQGTRIPMLKEVNFAVSMLISFMVVLLAMYTTIFERTREIGILKSIGASRIFVVSMVLRESAFVCILGVLFGTGISQLLRKILTTAFPLLQLRITLHEVGFACLLGIIAGLLGALYPAYKAARMDPVKALSYE
ncbi:MAG: FtsX-like permease family protein, partial [Acidobacteriota bacterium]